MSKQNETDSLIELQEKLLNCISSCRKYDFDSIESRINFCIGYLEEDYNCISDLLNYIFTGIDSDISF